MADRVQSEILSWGVRVFGPIALNAQERAIRFIEEALELAQVYGVSRKMVDALADRVWSKPKGEIKQETAQTLLTLESLSEVNGIDATSEADKEWFICKHTHVDFYREKYEKKRALGLTVEKN